jgi:Arc-like DNA binding domain
MPGVTVRLTPEQHEQLAREAKTNHRSLQGEILHRLFPPQVQTVPHPGYDSEQAALAHFKPDPKPGKKR